MAGIQKQKHKKMKKILHPALWMNVWMKSTAIFVSVSLEVSVCFRCVYVCLYFNFLLFVLITKYNVGCRRQWSEYIRNIKRNLCMHKTYIVYSVDGDYYDYWYYSKIPLEWMCKIKQNVMIFC